MGLDIYGHLVKKVGNDQMSVDECYGIIRKRRANKVKRFIKNTLSALEKVKDNPVEYEKEYRRIFDEKMPKITKYEYLYDKPKKELYDFDAVKKFFDEWRVWGKCPESDVYFRKVNFVYEFFRYNMVDECCFASKGELEDLVSRCEKVLADHSLAEELLPTCCGFFFGSTDYDEWYYKDVEDCKKQISELIKKFDEGTDKVLFIFSW